MLRDPGSPNAERRLSVEFGGNSWQRISGLWRHSRTAEQIRPIGSWEFTQSATDWTSTGLSQGVVRLPGAWVMHPLRGEAVGLIKDEFDGAALDAPGRAPWYLPANLFQKAVSRPSDLTGIGQTGVLATHPKMLQKRVPDTGGAPGDWGTAADNSLPGDVAAMPMPPSPVMNTIPMDRVAHAPGPFGANNGFILNFRSDREPYSDDALIRFYFGGTCSVTPTPAEDERSHGAGIFCLELRGGGQLNLFERSYPAGSESSNPLRADGWALRWSNRWSTSFGAPDLGHWFTILPYTENRIAFIGELVTGGPGFTLIDLLTVIAEIAIGKNAIVYTETPLISGHQHIDTITGVGEVRFDIRRDMRAPFGAFRLKFPETATLTDEPIILPPGVPDGTAIAFDVTQHVAAGGGILGRLFDSDTGDELPTDANGYLTANGQQRIIASFDFDSSKNLTSGAEQDFFATPALIRYDLEVRGAQKLRLLNWTEAKNWRSVSITGPDSHDVTHDTAGVEIHDVQSTAAVLRQRGRVQSRICLRDLGPATDIYGIPGNILSVLFTGETSRNAAPRAHKRGRRRGAAPTYGEDWQHYPVIRQNGMWVRIGDHPTFGMNSILNLLDASQGPEGKAAPKDASGSYLPFKVTDAIVKCLLIAGVRPEQMDIPDHPMRFVATSQTNAENFLITPREKMTIPIGHFADAYLGRPLIIEPNCRPPSTDPDNASGEVPWVIRLLNNADPLNDPVRMEFRSSGVGVAGIGPRTMTSPRAFDAMGLPGAPQAYIEEDSFDWWVEPPEFNHLRVVGAVPAPDQAGGGVGRKGAAFLRRLEAEIANTRSYDYGGIETSDPSSPDFLDVGEVEAVIIDLTADSQAAVNVRAARVYDFAGHGKTFGVWLSPLVTVFDDAEGAVRDETGALTGETRQLFVDGTGAPTQRPLRPQDIIWAHLMLDGRPQTRKCIVVNCNPDCKSRLFKMDMEVLILPEGF